MKPDRLLLETVYGTAIGRPGTPTGWVYLIADIESLRTKVGYSVSPERRLAQLRTASPGDLILLAVVPGTLADEAHWHAKFAAKRTRGEWFDLDQLDLAEIMGHPEVRAHIDGGYASIRAQHEAEGMDVS